MRDEGSAYKRVSHPSVLRILDDDIENGWFVTEFHKRGALWNNRFFAGNMEKSLDAFKSAVEAVCALHHAGLVHRDIKPQNVFVTDDGRLILVDLGLGYFLNESDRTWVTDSYENVGSRDWMPGWAMGMKIEDIKPSFDVF